MNLVKTTENLIVLDKSHRLSQVDGPKMRELDEKKVEELRLSFLEVGVINPITITATANDFSVIAGSHRWAAMCNIWDTLPDTEITMPAQIIVIEAKDILEYQIRENIERNDLKKTEIVAYAEKLKELNHVRHGGKPGKKTMQQIADEMGIPLRSLQRLNYIKKHGEEFLVKVLDDKILTDGECEKIIKVAKKNGTTQQAEFDAIMAIKNPSTTPGGTDEDEDETPDFLKTPEQIEAEAAKVKAAAKRAYNKEVKLIEGDILDHLENGLLVDEMVKRLEKLIRFIKKCGPAPADTPPSE